MKKEVGEKNDVKTEVLKNTQSDINNIIKSKIEENKKISSTSNSEEGFTGYKIVILFTKYPLPKGHLIFKNTKGLKEYNNVDDGYTLYLIGEYATYEEAKQDLDSKWKKSYKKSYIIRMENGLKTSL